MTITTERLDELESPWGADESYDHIDAMIDGDPIELGRLCRELIAEVRRLRACVCGICGEGCHHHRVVDAICDELRSSLDEIQKEYNP